MVVGAAGHQPEAGLGQVAGERLRVADDLRGVRRELGLRGFAERNCLRRDDVVEGPSLQTREQCLVDGPGVLGAAEDAAAAGAAERLVGRERHDVRVGNRARVRASGDETRDVSRVEDQDGAHLVADGAEDRGVDDAGVCGGAGEHQLGPVLAREIADLVVVEAFVARRDAVSDTLVKLAADVHRLPVRQVAPLVEAHAHERVARLQEGQADREVGVGPRVRLHVRVVRSEQRLGALTRQVFRLVDDVVAAVITLARVTLGVLVREDGTGRGQHRG